MFIAHLSFQLVGWGSALAVSLNLVGSNLGAKGGTCEPELPIPPKKGPGRLLIQEAVLTSSLLPRHTTLEALFITPFIDSNHLV